MNCNANKSTQPALCVCTQKTNALLYFRQVLGFYCCYILSTIFFFISTRRFHFDCCRMKYSILFMNVYLLRLQLVSYICLHARIRESSNKSTNNRFDLKYFIQFYRLYIVCRDNKIVTSGECAFLQSKVPQQ